MIKCKTWEDTFGAVTKIHEVTVADNWLLLNVDSYAISYYLYIVTFSIQTIDPLNKQL